MSILNMLGKAVWDLLKAFFSTLGVIFGNTFRPLVTTLRSVFQLRSDEVKRPLLVLVSILVIAASLVSIYLSQRTVAPTINMKPFQGLGDVVAEETAKLLEQQGTIVLLVVDTKTTKMPAFEAPVEAFLTALKAYPKIHVEAREVIEPKLQAMLGPSMLISADQFASVLEKYSRVDAIVSFVGLPTVKGDEWNIVDNRQSQRPQVISAGAFNPQLKAFMQRDIVQVAVTPRFRPGNESKEPETPREWFDRFYTVITPANMSELPDLSMPTPAPPSR